MFCPKCGTANKDDASFCANCGESLKRDSASENGAQAGGVATGMGNVVNAAGAAAATVSRKPWLKIAIPILAVVVIVLCAFMMIRGCEPEIESGVTPRSSVEDYSWEELSRISAEIGSRRNEESVLESARKYNLVNSNGELDGTQTKTIQLTNGKSATVQIAGFAHDEKTGGGKAGITFIFKDAIAERRMNSSDTNSGGWEKSTTRSWLAADGMTLLPQDLSSKIVSVDKKTNNTGKTDSRSAITITSDRLWLFSAVELSGIGSFLDDGSQYKLFKDCEVNPSGAKDVSNSILEKKYSGSSCSWWERTPHKDSDDNFWSVDKEGRVNMPSVVSHTYGVVPGFCI